MSDYSDAINALSPVGYWQLGELTGTVANDEIATYQGVYSTDVSGLTSNGLIVDDSDPSITLGAPNDYVSLTPVVENLTIPVSVVATCHLDPSKTTGHGSIIELNGVFGGKRLDIDYSTQTIDVYSVGEASNYVSIPFDTIVHVVGVWDLPNNKRYIYINGVEIANWAVLSTSGTYGGFNIGAHVQNSYFLKGGLDEVALFDKALSPAESLNLYNISKGIVELPANYKETVLKFLPDGYWRLGELSGTDVFDVIGQYDGIYGNTPTLGVDGLLTLDTDTAVYLNSAQAEYIQTGLTLPASANRTWSIVFKFDDITTLRTIICDSSDGTGKNSRIMLAINATGQWYFSLGDGVSTYTDQVTDHNLVIDTTYHLVIVQTDNIYQFYIDKVLVHTFTSTVDVSAVAGVSPLVIGRLGAYNGWFFDGTVDEFFVIDATLFQADIDIIYNAYQGIFLATQAFDIVIDHTKVDEDLYDFPLLVNLGASSGIDAYDSSSIFDTIGFYTGSEVSDDFTGNDGDPPNTGFWYETHTGIFVTNTLEILSNKVYYELECTTAGDNPYSLMRSNYTLNGDFDFQIDYDMIDGRVTNNRGILNTPVLGFYCQIDNNYQAIGNNIALRTYFDYTPSTTYTIASTGQLRFTRVGSLLTFWYRLNSGASWIEVASNTPASITETIMSIGSFQFNATTNGLFKFGYDNFVLNSVDGITWNTGIVSVEKLNAVYINPSDNAPEDYFLLANEQSVQAYWRLGESGGATLNDENNTYTGTYYNTPTLGVDGLLQGNPDTAVTFNGVDEYAMTNSTLQVDDTWFGISMIFKADLIADGTLIHTGKNDASNGQGIRIEIRTDGSIRLAYFAGAWSSVTSAVGLVAAGQKHHIVVTRGGSGSTPLYAYLDGVEIIAHASGDFSTIAQNIRIGAYWNTSLIGFFKGTIDEVTMYSDYISPEVALTLSHASKNYIPADTTVYSRQCKVEIDRWDQVNQQAQLWIKVPYISKDVDTIINLSYDPTNPDNSDNVGYTGELPAQEVWSEYDAVYHLSKDGADSTVNALHGTLFNIDDTNIVDFGIGKGMVFNGTDEYITTGYVVPAMDSITVSINANLSNLSIINMLFSDVNSANTGSTARLRLGLGSANWFISLGNDASQFYASPAHGLSIGIDYQITFVWNNFEYAVYVNGELNTSGTSTIDFTTAGVQNVSIGRNGDHDYYYVNGNSSKLHILPKNSNIGYVNTNYNSTQDTLVRYSGADAYLLAKSIIGLITENVAVVDWIIRAYRLDTGALTAELKTIAGAFQLAIPNGQWFPSMVTVAPEQGVSWVGNTAQLVNDLIFPTDPETTPYYFKCTVSGTGIDGVTGALEPTWPTVPGQTVVDGTVTWEVVERMIQPITHSPMIPK